MKAYLLFIGAGAGAGGKKILGAGQKRTGSETLHHTFHTVVELYLPCFTTGTRSCSVYPCYE